MEKGAATLKRVFLELGGKSAMIVCDDADFAAVLPSAGAACMHAGQGCALQTRVLLPRSRYAEGVELLTAVMQAIPYGDPTDPNVMQGPQVSARQRDRVLAHISKGVDEGANLVVGGHRPPQSDKGYFVEPKLFTDVDNSMTIAQLRTVRRRVLGIRRAGHVHRPPDQDRLHLGQRRHLVGTHLRRRKQWQVG
jgi:aldehyde dehydrogenase (NAD+)